MHKSQGPEPNPKVGRDPGPRTLSVDGSVVGMGIGIGIGLGFGGCFQLLFHWYATALVHLQTQFGVGLLQEHNRRPIELGQAVGQLDESVRPELRREWETRNGLK